MAFGKHEYLNTDEVGYRESLNMLLNDLRNMLKREIPMKEITSVLQDMSIGSLVRKELFDRLKGY